MDVLVSCAPHVRYSQFHLAEMQDELSAVFGRDVDRVTPRAVECGTNEWLRKAILESLMPVALAS